LKTEEMLKKGFPELLQNFSPALDFAVLRPGALAVAWVSSRRCPCMYLLTIREGLHTRHIGPYATTQQAADHLDLLLPHCGERVHWQIHELEPPSRPLVGSGVLQQESASVAA
jgi:hypothetical protein